MAQPTLILMLMLMLMLMPMLVPLIMVMVMPMVMDDGGWFKSKTSVWQRHHRVPEGSHPQKPEVRWEQTSSGP